MKTKLRDPNSFRNTYWYLNLSKSENENLDPGDNINTGPQYHNYDEDEDISSTK